MDTYIVRIYQQEEDNPAKPVGILEEIDSTTRQSFRGLPELCSLLTVCQRTKNGQQHGDCLEAKKMAGIDECPDAKPKCNQ